MARIEEENEWRKKNKQKNDFANAYMEQMHQEAAELLKSQPEEKTEKEEKVNQVSSHIPQLQKNLELSIQKATWIDPSEQKVKDTDALGSKKILGVEKLDLEEITTKTPQIVEMEKTTNPTIVPTLPQIEPTNEEPQIQPAEEIEEEAPVEDGKSESAQRKNLWEIWQEAATQLEGLLQDLQADPFDSAAAQKVMLLCSHLASQMNHESARALLDFIEDTRLDNLKKAYQPGAKEIIPLILQLGGALVGGFCGFGSAAAGLVGSQAKMLESASSISNNFVSNGASSVGQMISTVNQGKHSVVGHELESDKRLQQDLQQRRQQAEQAAKRELENIVRMAQQKHETVRAINQS